MEEQHQPQFRGVWIPAEIMTMQSESKLKAADVILLAILDSLVGPDHGCYASNEYLAKRTGRGVTVTRESIAKLKRIKLIKQIKFDGKRRHLETAWSRVGTTSETSARPVGCRETGMQGAGFPAPCLKVQSKVIQSGPTGTDGEGGEKEGFGIAPPKNGKATAFDITMADQLYAAVKTLKPERTRIECSKPSTWANHIRLLRTANKLTEDTIKQTMRWYAEHIGQDFVPEAYSGATFRQKYHAIERQRGRDLTFVEAGEEAHATAKRLVGLGWPKGSAAKIPAIAQVCLTEYYKWVTRRDVFIEELRNKDCGPGRMKLLNFGNHLKREMPPPAHFTQKWMEDINQQVRNWVGWNGEFAGLVFHPGAKRFQSMGRRWAEMYTGDPDRWDRFCKAMEKEMASV